MFVVSRDAQAGVLRREGVSEDVLEEVTRKIVEQEAAINSKMEEKRDGQVGDQFARCSTKKPEFLTGL